MIRKLCAAFAVALTALAGLGTHAWAHVTVNPSQATAGGYVKLTFRVPNERANASTVRLEVQFPTNSPLPSVSTKPTPGWSAAVDKQALTTPATSEAGSSIAEAVATVSWSGGVIKPGEFQEFDISVGPLPKNVESMTFKAVQTYDNGEVVRWVEERVSGQPEPKNPAPVLKLVPADDAAPTTTTHSAGTASGGVTVTTSGEAAGDGSTAGAETPGNDNLARALAAAGVLTGLIGLVAGLIALRRRTNSG